MKRDLTAPRDELYDRNWFKNRRLQLGLTQRQLAEACECDPSYVSGVEAGNKTPNVHLALKFTSALGLKHEIWIDEKRIA